MFVDRVEMLLVSHAPFHGVLLGQYFSIFCLQKKLPLYAGFAFVDI